MTFILFDQTLNSLLLSLLQVKDAASQSTMSKQLGAPTQVFSGHMKLVDVQYDQVLENTESSKFKDLASKLEAIVSMTPIEDDFPVFACLFYHLDCLL